MEINLEESAKILRKSEPDVMEFVRSGRLSHRYLNGQCLLAKDEVQTLATELEDAKWKAMLLDTAITEYQYGTYTLADAAHFAGISEAELTEILKNTSEN